MLQNYVVYLEFKINWVVPMLSDELPQGSYSFQPGKWEKEHGIHGPGQDEVCSSMSSFPC